MVEAFAWILATFITLPILFFYLVYFVTVKMNKNKKRAFRLAVDLSTIFFILATNFIIKEIWDVSLFWVIIVVMLMIAIVFTIIHWKLAEDILLSKMLRGIWRFHFLLFFALYIILSLYGLIFKIYQYTTLGVN